MITLSGVSAQKVSWVKSDLSLADQRNIHTLFYPETIGELTALVRSFYANRSQFDIIGYSSNTLFLPTYKTDNLICTTRLSRWEESDDSIICECGASVPILSKEMIKKGYVGFEGLTDLPGTVASAVYGNAGCRGCSINSLVESFSLLQPDGEIRTMHIDDLDLSHRDSALKRGKLKGVILTVSLKKEQGAAEELKKVSEFNHDVRQRTQPSGKNNLGTTIIGCRIPTVKGKVFIFIEKVYRKISGDYTPNSAFFFALRLWGKGRFIKYLFAWNRYMFHDEKGHALFDEYWCFVRSLYKDARLEIEIRK